MGKQGKLKIQRFKKKYIYIYIVWSVASDDMPEL